jgi:hypothetical protein
MEQYVLKFKEKPTPSYLHISACKVNGMFNVEVWDVNTNYFAYQDFEIDKQERLSELRDECKTSNKELANAIKNEINQIERYKNKRYRITEEELHEIYIIV